jgi:hypothetical protein
MISHLDVKTGSAQKIVDLDVLGANPRDPFLLCVLRTTAGSSGLDSAGRETLWVPQQHLRSCDFTCILILYQYFGRSRYIYLCAFS